MGGAKFGVFVFVYFKICTQSKNLLCVGDEGGKREGGGAGGGGRRGKKQ